MDTAQQEETVFAFDVSLSLSADDAARLIDKITPPGFYAWQMVPWQDAGIRVFCKRSKVSKPGELVEARRRAAEATRDSKDAEDTKADAALADILKASPRITAGLARVRLGRLGYRRGNDWVTDSIERAKAARR